MNKNNLIITSPTLHDIPTLWRWGEKNWELWGDARDRWFSKASLKLWLKQPEDDVLLVARNDDQLIGMCFTTVIRDWAFCLGLFVDVPYRGQGIGKRLLDETARRLRVKKIRNLSLLVDIKNTKAEKFYLREGFYKGFGFYLMNKDLKQ